MKPKVSVIIPVFNSEKYIERCAHSLFSQTLDELELIFVNDKTPDGSIELMLKVLDAYPHRKSQLKLIEMPVNSKVAAAREAGMKSATGEYMIHCDPDDWVEKDGYEKLYNKAKETDSDIVLGGMINHYKNGENKIKYYKFKGIGRELLLTFSLSESLCNTLIRSSIIFQYDIFPFRNINCGEDLNTNLRAFYYSEKVDYIDEVIYHYDHFNEKSITKSDLYRRIELHLKPNIEFITRFLEKTDLEGIDYLINEIKFSSKAALIWSKRSFRFKDAKYFCKLWPESHKDKGFFLQKPFLILIYRRYLKIRKAI